MRTNVQFENKFDRKTETARGREGREREKGEETRGERTGEKWRGRKG
jgi:hypothetical protein